MQCTNTHSIFSIFLRVYIFFLLSFKNIKTICWDFCGRITFGTFPTNCCSVSFQRKLSERNIPSFCHSDTVVIYFFLCRCKCWNFSSFLFVVVIIIALLDAMPRACYITTFRIHEKICICTVKTFKILIYKYEKFDENIKFHDSLLLTHKIFAFLAFFPWAKCLSNLFPSNIPFSILIKYMVMVTFFSVRCSANNE